MQRFEGVRTFALPPADVWAKLRDAAFLVQCIPDAGLVGTPTRERAVCTVRPGFAFMRGTLEVTLEILEAVEPSLLRITQNSKAIAATCTVETRLVLSALDSGTKVAWMVDIQKLGGLLKAVPTGLIRGAAQKIIGEVWQSLASHMLPSFGDQDHPCD